MSEIVINYKSSAIASMDASGTKTLLTSGKYCEDNIEVVYSRPSGAQIDALSVTQNGTYTAQTGHAYSPVTVAVPTPLIVTLEWDSNQSKWLPDKTFSEISAAWVAEREVVVACDGYPGEVVADGMMNDNGIEYFYCVREYIDVDVGSAIRETLYIMTSNGITVDFEYLYPYPSLENKTITPSESQQSVSYDSTAYTGIDTVTVNAISSSYVGSGITRRDSTDLSASGATVSVPSGYYASNASKSVSSGTEGTPTATKGAVSNHSISVTPSVTNMAGYISGGTKTGTAVTVSASELASGNKAITANGTNIDVVGYSTVSVDVQGGGGTSNVVTGTFKGTTTGAAMDVTLNYTGSGYPVVIAIYPSEGAYNFSGTFFALIQRYALCYFFAIKSNMTTSPVELSSGDYSSSSNSRNTYSIVARYKSSTSNAASFSNISDNNYQTAGGAAASTIKDNVIMISKNKLAVWIASSGGHGFAANIEYTYRIIYSS